MDRQYITNFSECRVGARDVYRNSLGGSQSIEILESKGDLCILRYRSELEGGYSVDNCEVPKSLGLFEGFEQISKYCRKKVSGNSLSGTSNSYVSLPGGLDLEIPTKYIKPLGFFLVVFSLVVVISTIVFIVKKRN